MSLSRFLKSNGKKFSRMGEEAERSLPRSESHMPANTAKRLNTRRLFTPIDRYLFEKLEHRALLASTLFVDFGFGFTGGQLSVTNADMATVNGPSVFPGATAHVIDNLTTGLNNANAAYGGVFDTDNDGTVSAAEAQAVANRILQLAARILEPFDVTIQQVNSADITGIQATFASTGNNDAYLVAAGVSDADVDVPNCDGSCSAFGWAPYDVGNTDDNTGFAFFGQMLAGLSGNAATSSDRFEYAARFMSRTLVHEAGHTWGLAHTLGSDTELRTRGDLLGAPGGGGDNRIWGQDIHLVTRFDLPLQSGPGNQNSFDLMQANVGLVAGSPFYVTGTGANDVITVTDAGGGNVDIVVQPFTDATFTTTFGGSATFLNVAVPNGILIEGGFAADRIVVNAGVTADIEVRGGDDIDATAPADDFLAGPDQLNTWNITARSEGTLNTNVDFLEIEIAQGGTGQDTANGVNSSAVWDVGIPRSTYRVSGTLFLQLENFEFLNGGSQSDTFNLFTGALGVGVDGGGGPGVDLIVGANANATWNIGGAGSGTISPSAVTFSAIEGLTGGTATDRFIFGAAGSIAQDVNGGGGLVDTLNFAAQTARSAVLTSSAVGGFSGTVAGSIGGTFLLIDRMVGSLAGSDSLTGLDSEATWTRLTATGNYIQTSTARRLTFINFETLNGGDAIDRFRIASSATFDLNVNGNNPLVAAPPPPATGDELEVILAGTTNPQLIVTTPYQAGRFEFDGAHRDVTYTGIERLNNFDFGDAPDSYGTALASSGARHRLGSDLKMGHVDPEVNGQPTGSGLGDDNTGTPDDENGVILPAAFIACLEARIDVFASGSGLLDAWIDFNGDGTFAPGEQIATNLAVNAGLNTFVIEVPHDAVTGFSFARFRLSSLGGTTPTGLAEDGEVEDHQVQLLQAPIGGVITIPDPLFPGGTLLVLGGTSGHDALIIERFHPDNTMRAILSGNVLATFPAVGVITRTAIVGREGNDTIVLDDELPQALEACGGEGNDSIASSSGEDFLKGDAGNDTINGLGNADRINGNEGNDVLWGAAGNDLISGGSGNDVVYAGTGNDTVFGDAGDDALYGEDGNDILLGGGGSDRIFGGAGLDVLIGGSGRDFVYGEGSDDLLVGSSTVHGNDIVALERIRAEWTSGNSYALRIINLRTGAGPNLMGTRLDPMFDIIADGVADDLFGGLDRDWFIADGVDNLFDRQGTEQIS
jgi:Ca2+-binding RTX toxin-like protein